MSEGFPSPGPARRLELAYLAVFGDAATRSPDQQLVWADIESHCYAHRLVSEGKIDGELALYRGLFNDGRRSVWLRIRGQLIKALAPPRVFKSTRKPIQHG